MMTAVYIAAALLLGMALSAAYVTLAVNLVANRQDRVNTMEPLRGDSDAFGLFGSSSPDALDH